MNEKPQKNMKKYKMKLRKKEPKLEEKGQKTFQPQKNMKKKR